MLLRINKRILRYNTIGFHCHVTAMAVKCNYYIIVAHYHLGFWLLCLADIYLWISCKFWYKIYRGFSQQPCCMAGTIKTFRKNIFPTGKSIYCSCHATRLPCKTSKPEWRVCKSLHICFLKKKRYTSWR